MRLPVVFVLLTVVIDAMGIGLIMPIMPDLLEEVHGGTLAQAAIWGGILSTAFALMQFLFGTIVGNLSDAYGRRPVMLVSLFVMALDYLIMAMAGTVWLLLLTRLIGGITAATHGTANAYMADVSKPEDKSTNFGLVGAAFGVGFVLGPLIGGVLGTYGTRAPFYAAAVLVGLNFCLGWFVMGETLTEKTRRSFDLRRANPFGAFRAMRKIPGIAPMVLVFFLYSVGIYVYPAVWSYFTQAQFGWDTKVIGLSLATYGISMALVQGVLLRHTLRRFGERKTILIGLVFEFIALSIFAFIGNGTLALALVPISAVGALIQPALQGLMSKAVGDNQQGELQGALTAVQALSMILSPLMMTATFAAFTRDNAAVFLPGAPFLVALVLMIIGALVFLANKPAENLP